MTLNINLVGGPGVGKSILMSDLFSTLKKQNIHCEKVPEYAKDLQYDGRLVTTPPLKIVTEQYLRQLRLQGKAEVAVTDAAVPLSLVYSPVAYRTEMSKVVRLLTQDWLSINVLVHKNAAHAYETGGRDQSRDEAQEFHENHVTPFMRSYYGESLLELNSEGALDVLVARILAQLRPSQGRG